MLTLEQYAEEMDNNHRQFESFGWHDRPEGRWCLYYTVNRDSDRLARVNHEVFEKELMTEQFGDDVRLERHAHWAVGWIQGFAIRVRDDSGSITPAFTKLHELVSKIEDYPILDEYRYSEVECDELAEDLASCIEAVMRNHFAEEFSDEVYRRVDEWIQKNDSGVYYEESWCNKEPAVMRALDELGYTRDE